MTLRLKGSNSGDVSLKAPATAGDNTITLPTSNGSAEQFLKNSGTAGELEFSSMVETSTGVGIGTSSPDSYDGNSNNLVIANTSGNAGLTIATSTSGDGTISWADGTSGDARYRGSIGYNHTNDRFTISTAGSSAVNIDSSGRLLVGNTSTANAGLLCVRGSAADSTGGAQISLQSGSSVSGANQGLGDYNFGEGSANTAKVRAFSGASWTGASRPTYMTFETTPSSSGSPSERMRITPTGAIRIGMSDFGNDPSASNAGLMLFNTNSGAINSSASATTGSSHAVFYNPNGVVGQIQSSGSSTSYLTSSDYRLKENVVDLDGAITRVKQLAPKRFNFIADADTTVDGFLAHEAQTVVPEAVTGTHNQVQVWDESEELPEGVSVGDNKLDEDGNTIPEYQGIDQSKLVPLLTAALQEAISKIETLETKVAALEAA